MRAQWVCSTIINQSYGSEMPHLYVCGFACVVCVLWHAEIWTQGDTKDFNEDTNGTSTSPMARNNRQQRTIDRHSIWKYDQGFGFVVGRLKFFFISIFYLFAVIQDLTPAVQFRRGSKEGKVETAVKEVTVLRVVVKVRARYDPLQNSLISTACQIWPSA